MGMLLLDFIVKHLAQISFAIAQIIKTGFIMNIFAIIVTSFFTSTWA
jgi:hypothetical protein